MPRFLINYTLPNSQNISFFVTLLTFKLFQAIKLFVLLDCYDLLICVQIEFAFFKLVVFAAVAKSVKPP